MKQKFKNIKSGGKRKGEATGDIHWIIGLRLSRFILRKSYAGKREGARRRYREFVKKGIAEGRRTDWVVRHVAQLLGMEPPDVLARGKYRQTVKARSLVCYWCHRELGMTTVELAKRLKLSQPTVSESVVRGQKIVAEEGLSLLEKIKL